MQTQLNDSLRDRSRPVWAAALAAAIVAACGGAAVLVVPFFTFGFGFQGSIDNVQHAVSMNLSPNEPTTSSGPFTANSNISFDGVEYPVQGSYSECSITITLVVADPLPVPAAPFAASYTGRFTDRDTIELTPTPAQPPRTVLKLTRSFGTDSRSTTC